ncbi:unnamed protein product, partial [Larinioides sclopetarius]
AVVEHVEVQYENPGQRAPIRLPIRQLSEIPNDILIMNTTVNDLNILYIEVTTRNRSAPRISKALFKRLTEQYLDPDEETEDLNEEEIGKLRTMFRTAQRIAGH